MSTEYCIGCQDELKFFDRDPNGEFNPICLRCVAEEEHDFTKYPKVKFDRMGQQIEKQKS